MKWTRACPNRRPWFTEESPLLDDPTQTQLRGRLTLCSSRIIAGFDSMNRRLLMDIVEEQKLAGATVIMGHSSNGGVERLCDRVILLKDGTVRAYGTVEDVHEQFEGTVYRVSYEGILPASEPLRRRYRQWWPCKTGTQAPSRRGHRPAEP